MIEFFVPGSPATAGSKRAFVVKGRAVVTDSVDTKGRGRDWRTAVRFAAADTGRQLDGPLRLSLWFYLPRPKGHRGKRGLLPSAPPFPTTKPDVLKLARAVEDACTGILWRDDAQIVDEDMHKLYADGGLTIGVRVRVAAVVPNSAAELLARKVCG